MINKKLRTSLILLVLSTFPFYSSCSKQSQPSQQPQTEIRQIAEETLISNKN
jgi:hypothetical protein